MKYLPRALGILIASFLLVSVASVNAMQDDDETTGSGDAAPAQPQTFNLAASDFFFDPKALNATPGAASFVVHNTGVLEHNFVIESSPVVALGSVTSIPVGATVQLDVTLASGTYTFACTLPGHREAGMVGTLVVTP